LIFGSTPSQTVGPYFAIGLPWDGGPNAVDPDAPGAIRIGGMVHDGHAQPVPDALIETWGADPGGRFADLYDHGGPSETGGFRGFARCGHEDGDGSWEIVTLKPGPVPGPGGEQQAPHLAVSIFARGMLDRCVTRIYFSDEREANDQDPVLRHVPVERRATLIAQLAGNGSYRFDIRLQGEGETVFFAL